MPIFFKRQRAAAALSILLCSPVLAMAGILSDPDPDAPEWTEADVVLPPAPQAGDMIVFLKNESQSFAIDSKSLSVAKDGTIRYTMIATSSSGAKNVSYEALRCDTAEKKLYAFGKADGGWSRSRRDQWVSIFPTGEKNQHFVLFTDYLCDGKTSAGKAPVLLERLRGQKNAFRN